MKIKYLHTFGNRDIKFYDGELPEMRPDQILVKSKLTGLCRCDIGAYSGHETPMPQLMQGHEGLSVVIKVGDELKDKVKEGDIVSTRSDPAFANYYYATEKEFTVVPEISPKYIIEPVACAVNIINKLKDHDDILLIGSGFMSIIILQYLKFNDINKRRKTGKGTKVTVVGSSNRNHFEKLGYELQTITDVISNGKKYKTVIDLSSKAENFDLITLHLADVEATIALCSTPERNICTNFFENSWRCHTFKFFSPRNSDFHNIMMFTNLLIQKGNLDPAFMWTKGYRVNNETELKEAFEHGLNRTKDYMRGYLIWPENL